MSDYSGLHAYLEDHRKRHRSGSGGSGYVISPTIQHSHIGAFGGLGDFVKLTSGLFPQIEWAVPLTDKIRDYIGDILGPAVSTIPVRLHDPITGDGFGFGIEVFAHRRANNSLTWLFYNEELMSPLTAVKDLLSQTGPGTAPELDQRYYRVLINQNSYEACSWPTSQRTLANTPGLAGIHPLLHRYVDRPDMLNAIVQGAISKAIVELARGSGMPYDTIWLQDWHFGGIAGELLLPDNAPLARDIAVVQHLHNALYQGIYPGNDLIRIMGWPDGHFSKKLYKVHGQTNLLGGVLNALRNDALSGKAITVSKNHAAELPTFERGAGLHHIFEPLQRMGKLSGINNPIEIPANLHITQKRDIEHSKPVFKKMVQLYFGLEPADDTFLLLWSHRFTHQKQVSAVLQAIEELLSEEQTDFQIVFFCDIHVGSSWYDTRKLEDLIDRFPQNVATNAFNPKLEMLVGAGADGAIMASYFEPFGYAPIWAALQGGLIITGQNGGQVDIFRPENTFFIDIRPDIDKPSGLLNRHGLSVTERFASPETYRSRVFNHNAASIKRGIKAAKTAYFSPTIRKHTQYATMQRICELAHSRAFSNEIAEQILAPRRKAPPALSEPSKLPRAQEKKAQVLGLLPLFRPPQAISAPPGDADTLSAAAAPTKDSL